jgi:hypothetical protein
MADHQEFSWKNFLLEGVMLALLAFFLNQRLENHKEQLAENTETLKTLLQANAPFEEQRRTAYTSILQSARQLTSRLDDYYNLAKYPPTEGQVMKSKLLDLEKEMSPTGGGSSTWPLARSEAWTAADAFVRVRDQYIDACSNTVKQQLDAFGNTVLDDLKTSVRRQRTEQSDTVAHQHLLEALDKLSKTINEALGLQRMVIK